MNVKDRYIGKPFLRLLECYILRAIGELSADEEIKLEAMTSELQKVYNSDGSWHEIVAETMAIPESVAIQIGGIWKKNCELAKQNGEILLPQDFAEMFVDHNFPT